MTPFTWVFIGVLGSTLFEHLFWQLVLFVQSRRTSSVDWSHEEPAVVFAARAMCKMPEAERPCALCMIQTKKIIKAYNSIVEVSK